MWTICDGKRNHLHFQLFPRLKGEPRGYVNSRYKHNTPLHRMASDAKEEGLWGLTQVRRECGDVI